MFSFSGPWQILVKEQNASFQQRIVISGSTNADGIHPGNLGSTFIVYGDKWTLDVEHNDGTGWSKSKARRLPDNSGNLGFRIETEDSQDFDYDDLILTVTCLSPNLAVRRRPF